MENMYMLYMFYTEIDGTRTLTLINVILSLKTLYTSIKPISGIIVLHIKHTVFVTVKHPETQTQVIINKKLNTFLHAYTKCL